MKTRVALAQGRSITVEPVTDGGEVLGLCCELRQSLGLGEKVEHFTVTTDQANALIFGMRMALKKPKKPKEPEVVPA